MMVHVRQRRPGEGRGLMPEKVPACSCHEVPAFAGMAGVLFND